MPPEGVGSEDEDVEIPPEVQDWVDETKGVERIISVALTTGKPRTAKWIADQAVVSERTAREHLDTFADVGVVASFKSSGVTRYQADEAFLHYREVSRCVKDHTQDEIVDKMGDIKEEIEDIKSHHDVESPEDLRSKAASEDTSLEEVRDYKKLASEWDTLRDRMEVLEDASRRFEKFSGSASAQV